MESTNNDESKEVSTNQQDINANTSTSGNQQTSNEKKEESIFMEMIERVIVSFKPLAFYIERAHRALRCYEEITVIGFENHMAAACTVVEALKRQNIAVVKKIETSMDIPLYRTANNVSFANPVPKVVIHLTRGKLAEYISGYCQRKIIDLYESRVKQFSEMTLDQLHKLDLENALHATEGQKVIARKEIEGKKSISLSDFIRYASFCIHPLLRDEEFKRIIEERYGISNQNQDDGRREANGSDKGDATANAQANENDE